MLGTLTSKFSKNIDFLLYFVSFAVFLCCIMCIIHPFGYVSAFILGYMEVELSICFPFLPIELGNSISSTKYLMFSHFFHCLSLAIFVCYYLPLFSDFCFVSAFTFLSEKILSFYVIAFNLFQKTFIQHGRVTKRVIAAQA